MNSFAKLDEVLLLGSPDLGAIQHFAMSQPSYSNLNMMITESPPLTATSSQSQFPAFSITPATPGNNSGSSTVSRPRTNSTTAFRAPAHKHAHHLHSIPPREKSTRTLIIDHILWIHGRTRFAQARAELGMTDRTGGPNFRNFVHRHRPENFEEDEEQPSDGEDVDMLGSRYSSPGDPRTSEEEERLLKQDLSLARGLRLRAEGVEKVITSMLAQPPTVFPNHEDDFPTPPASPNFKPQFNASHPHKLPNGVRLRLALGTVINDLFARQGFQTPRRHHAFGASTSQDPPTSISPPLSNATLTSGSAIPAFSLSALPPSLLPLSSVSGAPGSCTRPLFTTDSPRLLASPVSDEFSLVRVSVI
jgi:hypothetical protein